MNGFKTHKTPDILVVEDDIETIEGILSELELKGYSYDHVSNLSTAIRKLKSTKYRVILLDLRMPGQASREVKEDGGLQLLQRLRSGDFGEVNEDVPYALLSAQDFRVQRLEARISDPDALARIRFGRIAKFQKGDLMKPLVDQIVAVLSSSKAPEQ